jgi:hypothetical protein
MYMYMGSAICLEATITPVKWTTVNALTIENLEEVLKVNFQSHTTTSRTHNNTVLFTYITNILYTYIIIYFSSVHFAPTEMLSLIVNTQSCIYSTVLYYL